MANVSVVEEQRRPLLRTTEMRDEDTRGERGEGGGLFQKRVQLICSVRILHIVRWQGLSLVVQQVGWVSKVQGLMQPVLLHDTHWLAYR